MPCFQYKDHEEVILWMNTVGPYHNRQETYAYFSLPFCVGTKQAINHYHETLSEALEGVELEFSGYEIDFTDDISVSEVCMVELDDEKVKAFVYAVRNDYWYQMYIDGLPIWGKVGEKQDEEHYIFTHKRFDIGYNGKHIVDVNIATEKKVMLKAGAKLKFTYEVNWKASDVLPENRFDKYLDPNFFQHRVRGKWRRLQKFLLIYTFLCFRSIGSAFSTVS